jgi:hypothetical protein
MNRDNSRRRVIQPVEESEESGFPRSTFPNQHHGLSGLDREMNLMERTSPIRKNFAHVVGFKNGNVHAVINGIEKRKVEQPESGNR